MAASSQADEKKEKKEEKVLRIEVQGVELFNKEFVCESGKEYEIIVKPEPFHFSL